MDLLSYALVPFTSKFGPNEGSTKDQLMINPFFKKKFFKTYIPSRIFM